MDASSPPSTSPSTRMMMMLRPHPCSGSLYLPFLTSFPSLGHPLVSHLDWKPLMRNWILGCGWDFTPHPRLLPISPACLPSWWDSISHSHFYKKRYPREGTSTGKWRSVICLLIIFTWVQIYIQNFLSIQLHCYTIESALTSQIGGKQSKYNSFTTVRNWEVYILASVPQLTLH